MGFYSGLPDFYVKEPRKGFFKDIRRDMAKKWGGVCILTIRALYFSEGTPVDENGRKECDRNAGFRDQGPDRELPEIQDMEESPSRERNGYF